tara:strand:- start:323 stop:670 length:348 start_codon:yes stop_codon:yes gene_type:complete
MTTKEQTREWLESQIEMVNFLVKLEKEGQYCVDMDFLTNFMTHFTNIKECEMKNQIAEMDGKFEGILTHLLNYDLGESPKRVINAAISEINSKYTPIDVIKQQIKDLENNENSQP